jgi:hypothetical protein
VALPDFVIIGAMKCGTTTLQEQLAAQPGVFMSTPKEPNFFSDDPVWAKGLGWYESLFADAPPGALKGEASTHYAKLPTYPACADRLAATLPDARLIYVTRDPFARLVSHYIHEWTMGVIRTDLETALTRHPELVAYGRYAMQLAPYVARFGRERILLTSLERLEAEPDAEFARIGAFLGAPAPFVWRRDLGPANVSAERIRRLPFAHLLIDHPVAAALRRTFAPKALREFVKDRLRMKRRPVLSEAARARLAPVFEEDRAALARLFPEAAVGSPG